MFGPWPGLVLRFGFVICDLLRSFTITYSIQDAENNRHDVLPPKLSQTYPRYIITYNNARIYPYFIYTLLLYSYCSLRSSSGRRGFFVYAFPRELAWKDDFY